MHEPFKNAYDVLTCLFYIHVLYRSKLFDLVLNFYEQHLLHEVSKELYITSKMDLQFIKMFVVYRV